MADKDSRMLLEATLDYLQRIKSVDNHNKGNRSGIGYTQILIDFLLFAINKGIAWENMFTFDTFREFRKYTNLKNASHALIGLSSYLHDSGKIPEPLKIPNYQVELPDTYEQYLVHLQQTKEVSNRYVGASRRVLASLHAYLENHKISLCTMKIENLDAFLEEINKPLSTNSRKTYLFRLRDFLKYLYYERSILKKDFAPLLRGPILFSQSKPPKFLRPEEIQKLFANLALNSPTQIRTYPMVHLSYSLGLRPVEISKITLDDISFQRAELRVQKRKTNNPVILPISDKTLKAITAYVLKVRPKTAHRELFLTSHAPYRPVSSAVVIYHISKVMKEAGLCSTSYWLRHSYAQNLFQIGHSIYEIKEMMGHESIQSTQRYLHIHTEMMRKVLFDETL